MSLDYIGYYFQINPVAPFSEILIAQLAGKGFDSFTETDTGIEAFILQELDCPDILDGIQILTSDEVFITMERKVIETVNWNQEWENNFDPIEVAGRVGVRAPFHASGNLEHEIIIEPKMSFGTGHHQTTHMMLEWLLEIPLVQKATLDMGCGTGVLAILAAMRGAFPVDAIDIDAWCYENSLENVQRNGFEHIHVSQGTAANLGHAKYDLIIANINRNILLQDIPVYRSCMNPGGVLLLSGFYEDDIPLLEALGKEHGLTLTGRKERDNWRSLKFEC